MTTNRREYQREYVERNYKNIRTYRTLWQNYNRAKIREQKGAKLIKEIHQRIELLVKMFLNKGRIKKSGKK